MEHKKNGFSLVELLIVLGIIGLLMVIGVILLGTARERARDAKRLSDMQFIKQAMEDFYYNNNKYPQAPTPVTLGDVGSKVICSGTPNGFAETRSACGTGTVYLDPIPTPPEPKPAQLSGYIYTATNPTATYTLDAALEGAVNGLSGKIEITPGGLIMKQ